MSKPELAMSVVVAPDHVQHNVATGVWCGVTEATDELLARAEIGFYAMDTMTCVGFSELDRATVFVHEGGYVLPTLAEHTLAVLGGFES